MQVDAWKEESDCHEDNEGRVVYRIDRLEKLPARLVQRIGPSHLKVCGHQILELLVYHGWKDCLACVKRDEKHQGKDGSDLHLGGVLVCCRLSEVFLRSMLGLLWGSLGIQDD